jgi:hypothetical protein
VRNPAAPARRHADAPPVGCEDSDLALPGTWRNGFIDSGPGTSHLFSPHCGATPGPMSHLRIARRNPSAITGTVSGFPDQPNGSQRETHGQGHDRNKCTLQGQAASTNSDSTGRPMDCRARTTHHAPRRFGVKGQDASPVEEHSAVTVHSHILAWNPNGPVVSSAQPEREHGFGGLRASDPPPSRSHHAICCAEHRARRRPVAPVGSRFRPLSLSCRSCNQVRERAFTT